MFEYAMPIMILAGSALAFLALAFWITRDGRARRRPDLRAPATESTLHAPIRR